MSAAYTDFAIGLEILLALIGLVLLWRLVVSPRARAQTVASPLPAWNAEPTEFLWLLLLVMVGYVFFGTSAGVLLKRFSLTGDAATIVAGAAAQFGMLAGVLAFAARTRSFRVQAVRSAGSILKSGVATFVISLPILDATSKAWELLLNAFGVPAERQDLIRMFADAKSPGLLTALVGLAIVIAPLTEELIFRAGIFRFMRTRTPRFLAFLVPALVFAALHINWATLEGFASFAPLLVLALLFSFAYERTGHIGTPIIAHALFNLNTIILIFCGVGS